MESMQSDGAFEGAFEELEDDCLVWRRWQCLIDRAEVTSVATTDVQCTPKGAVASGAFPSLA